MGRKFIVDEADLIEMLMALMESEMNARDGVDNWGWYGSSYEDVVRDNYPEQLSEEELHEHNIDFEACAKAILDAGKYQEQVDMGGLVNQLARLLNTNEAMSAIYG